MRAKHILRPLFVFVLLVGFTYTAIAGTTEPPPKESEAEAPEVSQVNIDNFDIQETRTAGSFSYAPTGQNFLNEAEPNGTFSEATPLNGSDLVAYGNVFPNADLDFFSFSGNAGDRVYAAVMTSFSSNGSTDSVLQLLSTDGVTILESDLDDGSLGGLSSSIAGTVLPASGTYYLRVSHNSATNQLRPYHLHVRIQTGFPTPETEPNDSGQALPVSQWVSGDLSSLTDVDIYTMTLNAGDTVYLSLDLDPERDTVEWNGWVGLGLFNGFFLVVNDGGTSTPDSEAFFMTVKDTGTYAVLVSVPTGGTTFGTYHLNVSVHPAEAQACTTYVSTDPPIAIADLGITTSSITIPGNPQIGDLNVALDLTHTNMPDLDVSLISPQANHNGLFSDIGINTQTVMNLGLDDEAGVSFAFTVVSGMVVQPELNYKLDWFDGEDAGGTWTLEIRDDTTANTGTLNSWSIILCDPEPPPVCPLGTTQTTLYSSDFEANNGGFTHSGTQDEWEWGLPILIPITSCNSGTSCWKTDLDNTYNASSSMDLLSPSINLNGYVGAAWVTWSQRYHIESASFDHAFVNVQETGGTNPRTLWQWYGATMNNTIGNPSTTINESAGWGMYTADISDYLGQDVQLNFHLDSDTTVQLTGWAIDDVSVIACAPEPEISLAKTVGTDPSVCATTDSVAVAPGTDVTYCYTVTNTGPITLTQHTLVDTELGTILNDFPYSLAPSASAYLTVTTNITETTVNTATWTAFNPGPINVATATDVATVTIAIPPSIVLTKTVGTDAGICATTDVITVTYGTNVTYCYAVENTGGVTLNAHTLTDSALGNLFSNLPYPLVPGEVVTVTTSTPLYVTTVNTATWEAFNPGGYTYNNTVPINWIEISATGTPLNLTDDSEANVTMPFQFTFYGVTSDLVRIGNNGGVLFATTTGDVAVTNAALPNAVALAMYPFWDDIDADTGNVYYETQGTAPNRQFIVEWFDRPHFSNSPGHVTFQMILFEGTNEILFNYLDVDFSDPQWNFGASATVGVNENATSATQYSFNTASVADNSAILFSPTTPAYASASDTATVNVGLPPTIEVTPDNLTSSQVANTVIVQTLTISNTGGDDLDWSIGEEAPTSLLALPSNQPNRPAGNPADAADRVGTDAPSVSVPSLPSTFEVPSGVLYDNGPLTTHPGGGAGGADASALQTALTMNSYGFAHSTTTAFRVADDFTVPAGGWTLDQVIFYAYQTGSTTSSTITGVYLRIWDGPPNAGGNVIWGDTTTNIMSSTIWSNIYRTLDTDLTATNRPIMANTGELGGLYLPAGTYWLDWQTSGSLASGPWVPPVTVLGSTGTGNAMQFDGTNWVALVDVGPQDLPFQLMGSGEPPVCATLGDIPWVSVNPITGTTTTGSATDVDVTFDSTGLSAGVYTGTLCITSNDPNNPLVTVPLTLMVEALTYGVDLSGDDAGSGAPGTTVSYVVTITNTGNTTDTFDLTAAGTWTTGLSDPTVTLGAGASTTFTVDVDVPSDALAGDSDIATITATSQGDGTSADTTLLTTAADAVYGVALSADQASSGAPGDTVTYIVTITNTGNTTDTFDLSAGGVWAANLSETSLILAAGESTTFSVEVTIDAGAGDGDLDVTTVTATSQNDASATDSTTLTTTAVVPPEEGYSIYLPLILKANP